MRLTRTLGAATTTLSVLVLVGSAVTPGLLEPASAVSKPRHELRVDAKEIDSANRFVLYGKASTYPRGRITVKRSVAGGPFRRLEKVRTGHSGRFRERIYQVEEKLTCFKVVVPATDDHRRTVSQGAVCIESA